MRTLVLLALVGLAPPAYAQSFATRLAVILAEARGAKTLADLQTIRLATRNSDTDTARLAVRALGRLERPSLASELLVPLRHMQPEVRAEAANALAETARGIGPAGSGTTTIASIQSSLIARLAVEDDAGVRATIAGAIARLPYRLPADVERAETAILELGGRATGVADRLGVAKALEELVRIQTPIRPASAESIAALRELVRIGQGPGQDVARDARVRRLALEGLTDAAAVDDGLMVQTTADPDAQVRRLAMRAAGLTAVPVDYLLDGVIDRAAMVRVEALRALGSRDPDAACRAGVKAASDSDLTVALVAVDTLASCGRSPAAVAYLERAVADRSELAVPRGWHHNAHALLALATAAPERVASALADYARSSIWQVRMYAARAAALAHEAQTLAVLAGDPDARVADVARAALGTADERKTARTEPLPMSPVTVAELTRLAAPRARITIRDVGRFELALFASEAPATVLRFARLAESGYYNGLTFDRVAPNAVVQGGWRPGGAARYPEDEIGEWPHVRGAVAISESYAPDGQFFIDLVDAPQFDHKYAVFGQVLNGASVIDQILEGDVIESIEILP